MTGIYIALRNFVMVTVLGYTSELPPEIEAEVSRLYALGRKAQCSESFEERWAGLDHYHHARVLAARHWRWVKK